MGTGADIFKLKATFLPLFSAPLNLQVCLLWRLHRNLQVQGKEDLLSSSRPRPRHLPRQSLIYLEMLEMFMFLVLKSITDKLHA